MDKQHQPEAARLTARPFQFSLKHLLVLPVIVAVFFAVAPAVGTMPAVLVLLSLPAVAGLRYRRIRPLAMIALGLLVGLFLLTPLADEAGSRRRPSCMNNLKNLSLALLAYHDAQGMFPPAYIADENGRPMHSWRVLILPYLDRQDIWMIYRMNEPWDGPNNRKLADIDLEVFKCPSDTETPTTMTNYVAVVGPNTAWPGTQQISLKDLSDGVGQTILLVEVANSGIHWMEPRDLYVAQMAPDINPTAGQGISSFHPGCALVSFADGHTEVLRTTVSSEELRAMLTRSGNEAVDANDTLE